MKKLVLVGITILISCALQAQLKYEAGVRGGFNLAIQTTTGEGTNVESGWKPGFHAGAYGTVFFLDKLAGQLEILFSQKGSIWTDPYFSGKDNLGYIDIPVLVRLQLMDLVNIHAGPQFSILACAKQIPDDMDPYDAMDYYTKTDVGVLVGVEVNLPMKLNIALRFVEGLSVTTEPTYYLDEWKNRVIQLSLSYALFRN